MRILDLTILYQPEIDALIHKLLELEEINLDVAENITDIGVIALLNIIGGGKPKKLNLSHTNLSLSNNSVLTSLSTLEELSLNDCPSLTVMQAEII